MTARGAADTAKVDILIPCAPKDVRTLPFAIDAARKHVRHPIGRIYVVAPRNRRIKAVCRRKNVSFVDERRVLPFSKNRYRYRTKTRELSGWLYQQLLKLSGDRVCRAGHFLVLDADTLLIRPHRFLRGGKTVFYCRNWSRPEYFRTLAKLLGRRRASSRSFVAHCMLFSRRKLAILKKTIEKRHGIAWHEAIWRAMDKTKPYAFSEYETYGNFVYGRDPRSVIRLPALNRNMASDPRRLTERAIRRLARSYRSLSFHKRKGYRRTAMAGRSRKGGQRG
jgi:hypothetical protein